MQRSMWEGRSDTNDHVFSQGEKEDQDIAEGCRRLIKNTLIGWNYLYLTKELMEAIRNDSVTRWSHFNLQGEYNFSDEKNG